MISLTTSNSKFWKQLFFSFPYFFVFNWS